MKLRIYAFKSLANRAGDITVTINGIANTLTKAAETEGTFSVGALQRMIDAQSGLGWYDENNSHWSAEDDSLHYLLAPEGINVTFSVQNDLERVIILGEYVAVPLLHVITFDRASVLGRFSGDPLGHMILALPRDAGQQNIHYEIIVCASEQEVLAALRRIPNSFADIVGNQIVISAMLPSTEDWRLSLRWAPNGTALATVTQDIFALNNAGLEELPKHDRTANATHPIKAGSDSSKILLSAAAGYAAAKLIN